MGAEKIARGAPASRLRPRQDVPRHRTGLTVAVRLFQGGQELPAGLLAAPAGLLADPAVRVHPGVPLALVAAALAAGHAGLEQGPGDAGVVDRGAAYDPDGGGADVGALQAQPDARDH